MEITKQHFADCGWKQVLASLDDVDYCRMAGALYDAAGKTADNSHAHALRLLGAVCRDIYPVLNGAAQGAHSCLNLRNAACAVSSNPRLAAALGDLLWGAKKDYSGASTAIENYLKIPLAADTWSGDAGRCWKRALTLARLTGNTMCIQSIREALLEKFDAADAGHPGFIVYLAELLENAGLKTADQKGIAEELEQFAKTAADDGHCSFRFAAKLAEKAAKFFGSVKDADAQNRALNLRAEYLTKSAEADKPWAAHSCYNEALGVLMKIPQQYRLGRNVDQRIKHLQSLIDTSGAQRLETLRSTVMSIDGDPLIEAARVAVSGRPPEAALRIIADCFRVGCAPYGESSLLECITARQDIACDGRTTAQGAGVSTRWKFGIFLTVHCRILPALDVVRGEHSLNEDDFIDLVKCSAYVPNDRKKLYAKALFYGYQGDFCVALHLLAPQIEHSIRMILRDEAESTRRYDTQNGERNGTQTENSLNALIDRPALKTCLGEDMVAEIKAVFCDPSGPNLRNNIAHGLLGDQDFEPTHNHNAIYAWAVGLRLALKTPAGKSEDRAGVTGG